MSQREFSVSLVEELDELSYQRFRSETNESQSASFSPQDAMRLRTVISELWKVPKAGSGDVLAGARIEEIVGKGAFGTVWRAVAVATGEPCAVKIFDTDRLGDGLAVHLFRRGVRAMLYLRRQNDEERSQQSHSLELSKWIVKIREVAPHMLAFSMDWIPGGDLSGGYIRGKSLEEKLRLFHHITNAVLYAHTRPEMIVHRDIKPQNIVMNGDLPILTDFDIADMAFAKTLSRRAVGGAFAYAAPEQLSGDCGHLEHRSDIYSLGRLLHFFLIERDPPILIERNPPLEDLNEYPEGLVKIIRRCTHRDVPMRYASVQELLDDIAHYEKSEHVGAFGPNAPMAERHWQQAEMYAAKGAWDDALQKATQAQRYLEPSHLERAQAWSMQTMWWQIRGGRWSLAPRLFLLWLRRLSLPKALGLLLLVLAPLALPFVSYIRTEARQDKIDNVLQRLVKVPSLKDPKALLLLSFLKEKPWRLQVARKRFLHSLEKARREQTCRIFTLLYQLAPQENHSLRLEHLGQKDQIFHRIRLIDVLAQSRTRSWGPIVCPRGRSFPWLLVTPTSHRMRGARRVNLHLPGADLRMLEASHTLLDQSNMSGSDLRLARLNGAHLGYSRLIRSRWDQAQLRKALFLEVLAMGSSFRFADMRGVVFNRSNLSFSDFRHARLMGADFRYTKFRASLFRSDVLPAMRKGQIDRRVFRNSVCLTGGHFLQVGLAERCHQWHRERIFAKTAFVKPAPAHCPTRLTLYTLIFSFPPGTLRREGKCPWHTKRAANTSPKATSQPTRARLPGRTSSRPTSPSTNRPLP